MQIPPPHVFMNNLGLEFPPVEFHEQLGAESHVYLLDGRRVPSVSQISDLLPKEWYVPWILRVAREALLDEWLPKVVYTAKQIKEAVQKCLKTSEGIASEATDIGNSVHGWISRYINFQIQYGTRPTTVSLEHYDEQARNAIEEFRVWETKHEVKWLASELLLSSRKYQFAGTTDFLAIVSGIITLGDFKTSKRVSAPYFLQTAGYQIAFEEADVHRQYPIGQRLILLLPKTGAAFQVTEPPMSIQRDKEIFLNLRAAMQWREDLKALGWS